MDKLPWGSAVYCLSVYTRRGEMEEKKEVPSQRKATDRRIRGEQKPQGDMRGSSRDWCGGTEAGRGRCIPQKLQRSLSNLSGSCSRPRGGVHLGQGHTASHRMVALGQKTFLRVFLVEL